MTISLQPNTAKSYMVRGNGLVINDFFPQEKYAEVLDFALTHEQTFRASQTVTQENDYRKSSLMFSFDFPQIYEWMKTAILAHFPRICHQLGHDYFPITEIEMQMTAHNDGNFYKMHNDSGSADTCTRELTYVYYFYQEPRQFSGGDLRLYDTVLQNKQPLSQTPAQLVTPQNNSIVFFDSDCQHEVLPVVCPSQMFAHSRFTINGWLRV